MTLEQIIGALGGATEIAKRMPVSRQLVTKWKATKRVSPIHRAALRKIVSRAGLPLPPELADKAK